MKIELLEKRTRNSKTHSLGNNKYSLAASIGSIHYQDENEIWQEIDNIFESALSPWNWQMLKAGYHIRVKEDFTAGQIIEFEKQGEAVQFQPMALEWTNDLDQIQPISMPQNVTPIITNPEVDLLPAVGMPSHHGTIRWANAYGAGIDFEWRCTSTRLVKILNIQSFDKLPTPEQWIIDGGNPVLRLNLIFDPSEGVDIYVDDELWNKKTKKQTFNVIEFRKNDEVLWGFMPLRYWGSYSGGDEALQEANEGQSVAILEKKGNKLHISIRVPYEWLQNAIYPVFIDTTVDEQIKASTDDALELNGNMWLDLNTILLSTETRYCGLRFVGINIPSGVTIGTNTYLSLYLPDDTDDFFTNKDIYCENTNNPGTFTLVDNNITDRIKTTNYITLPAGKQGEGWKNTPALDTEVQEVVDDNGGTGDALVFIIDSTGGEDLEITAWDGDVDLAAKLYIEYSVEAPTFKPQVMMVT